MYKTVFEISQNIDMPFYIHCAFGIIPLFFGIIEYDRFRKGKISRLYVFRRRSIVPTVLWSIAFLVGFSLAVINFSSWYKLTNIYKTGKYDVLEGQVFVYHKQPKEGHDEGDIIKVGNEKFIIDATDITYAYNTTIANGGVLEDGVHVKLYHFNGKILRIDILDEHGAKGN